MVSVPRNTEIWKKCLQKLYDEYKDVPMWAAGSDELRFVDFVRICIARIEREKPLIDRNTWKENCINARMQAMLLDKEVAEKIGVVRGAINKVEYNDPNSPRGKCVTIKSVRNYLEAFSYIYLENPYILLGVEPRITLDDLYSCEKGTDSFSKYVQYYIELKGEKHEADDGNRTSDETRASLSTNEKMEVMKQCLMISPLAMSDRIEADLFAEYIGSRYLHQLITQEDEYVQYVLRLLKLRHTTAKYCYDMFLQIPAIRHAIKNVHFSTKQLYSGNTPRYLDLLRSISAVTAEEERAILLENLKQLDYRLDYFRGCFPEYITLIGKMLLVPPKIQTLFFAILRDGGIFTRPNVFFNFDTLKNIDLNND